MRRDRRDRGTQEDRATGERPRRGYGDFDRSRRDPRRRSDEEPHERRGLVHPDEQRSRDARDQGRYFRRGGAGEPRFIGPAVQSGWGPETGDFGGGGGVIEDRPDPYRGRRPHGPEGWAYGGLGYRPEPPGAFQGVGPKGYRRSDRLIYEDVCEWLTEHEHIDASKMEVKVEDGVVHLRGTVPDRVTKRRAEDIAHAVLGVHDVMNELRIARPRSTPPPAPREPSNGEERR